MKFSQPLISGTLLRRYKRFLLDVELAGGDIITAHTANTGAMTGCSTPGSRVWLSRSPNPKRKYPLSWELVEVAPQVLCGINTQLSNALVREAIEARQVAELIGYSGIRSEVAYGNERSRIDLLLEASAPADLPSCYVEVKNVTLVEDDVAYFPDAISARGSKHLRELMAMTAKGYRAVIFYCVQREDCLELRPADAIDAIYGQTLREALDAGVEALAYKATVTIEGVELTERLPVVV
jgi:sugar fermentation stimulation protein A